METSEGGEQVPHGSGGQGYYVSVRLVADHEENAGSHSGILQPGADFRGTALNPQGTGAGVLIRELLAIPANGSGYPGMHTNGLKSIQFRHVAVRYFLYLQLFRCRETLIFSSPTLAFPNGMLHRFSHSTSAITTSRQTHILEAKRQLDGGDVAHTSPPSGGEATNIPEHVYSQ